MLIIARSKRCTQSHQSVAQHKLFGTSCELQTATARGGTRKVGQLLCTICRSDRAECRQSNRKPDTGTAQQAAPLMPARSCRGLGSQWSGSAVPRSRLARISWVYGLYLAYQINKSQEKSRERKAVQSRTATKRMVMKAQLCLTFGHS